MAALIVGICAFAVGFIPIVGVVVGLAAVVIGISALRQRQPKVLALTGAILGGVAIVASIAVTIGIAAFMNGVATRTETAIAESQAEQAEQDEQDTADEFTEPQDTEPADDASDAPAVDPNAAAVPADYTDALESADIYANMMDMSKAAIYDQLVSEYGEGASPEAAQYAIDTVTADWEANALATAQLYRDEMSMSPAEIRDQLTTEYGGDFTQAEADYAMENLDD